MPAKRSGSAAAAETVKRQWRLLRMIRPLPHRISAARLHERLSAEFDVSLRTVQRDLTSLSIEFPLQCELQGRAQYWYWEQGHQQIEIPGMSGPVAATLLLARDYLKPLLPAAVLDELKPWFARADEVLDETKLKNWHKKVRILERGPVLIPPPVNSKVRDVVYQALLEGKRIRARYQARERDEAWSYILSPLGLVLRSGIFYLVAVNNDYDDPVHFALHRMQLATLLDAPAKSLKHFDLNNYVDTEVSFAYPVSPKKIRLIAVFDSEAAFHLREAKLSANQTLSEKSDGRVLVTAMVTDTHELRWWLRGFGKQVEILTPKGLLSD